MFSSFIPIHNTERSNSPPPVKPIFTNKMQNGKRSLDTDELIVNSGNDRHIKKNKN